MFFAQGFYFHLSLSYIPKYVQVTLPFQNVFMAQSLPFYATTPKYLFHAIYKYP